MLLPAAPSRSKRICCQCSVCNIAMREADAAVHRRSSHPPPAPPPATRPMVPLLFAAAAGSNGGAVDTSRYVAELQALREVLVAAKAEQEALEKRVGEVGARRNRVL